MKNAPTFRLSLIAVALAWGITLSAQPQPSLPPNPDTQTVQCRIAGFPRPDAEPGQRIFFTVQEDVFQDDSLRIAAGARAKGRILHTERQGATLRQTIQPEAVQTLDGKYNTWDVGEVTLTFADGQEGAVAVEVNGRLAK